MIEQDLIITPKSILDSDLYKFTMQQVVLERYPDKIATYKFKNRGKQRFNDRFLRSLEISIKSMAHIQMNDYEYNWLKNNVDFLSPTYLQYLRNYRFNPEEVKVSLDKENNLVVDIAGPWHSTILWEVPLMAIISELYFKIVETDWADNFSMEEYVNTTIEKGKRLEENGCTFIEFGTRRRRSFEIQNKVVKAFASNNFKTFYGTSNVYFAYMQNIKPVGTMAHEVIMGISAIDGLRHANRYALKAWSDVYDGDLGIALTDTFGSDAFFKDFDGRMAKMYDGVRHDSGSPFEFTDKVINHYKSLGIDPTSKFLVFSDSLNVDLCIELAKYCKGKIKFSFGIGTHFTNDLKNSKALNMVIKLKSMDGIEVVKLSDDLGKASGDEDALRVARWTFFGAPLDKN